MNQGDAGDFQIHGGDANTAATHVLEASRGVVIEVDDLPLREKIRETREFAIGRHLGSRVSI